MARASARAALRLAVAAVLATRRRTRRWRRRSRRRSLTIFGDTTVPGARTASSHFRDGPIFALRHCGSGRSRCGGRSGRCSGGGCGCCRGGGRCGRDRLGGFRGRLRQHDRRTRHERQADQVDVELFHGWMILRTKETNHVTKAAPRPLAMQARHVCHHTFAQRNIRLAYTHRSRRPKPPAPDP